jgi:hypothetical protein
VGIVLSEDHNEPRHEDLDLADPGNGGGHSAPAKPKKPRLSRLFMFRVSEDMHARIIALGGSKWLRKVVLKEVNNEK